MIFSYVVGAAWLIFQAPATREILKFNELAVNVSSLMPVML
jgi:hypothetical protein